MSLPTKPKARGRPPNSKEYVEEERARIAACAEKLFHDEGFTAVSMRRLAQASGITVMTLYKYYDRKIDILHDLWAKVFEELFDRLDRAAARKRDPKQRIHDIALGYVRFWLESRDRYFLVFMSSGVTQSDVSIFVGGDRVVSRFGLFRAALAQALGDDAGDAELTLKTDLLLCALNGIAHNLITISAYPWSKPEDLVRAAVAGILGD